MNIYPFLSTEKKKNKWGISMLTLLTLLFLIPSPVKGEILEVRANWNSASCTPKCAEMLDQQFKKIREAETVDISLPAGEAVFKWKPNGNFSYYNIKRPMQMIGVGLNEIRVKVRGKAHAQGPGVAISSSGDGTLFMLISPFSPQAHSYTSYANPIFYELSPSLKDQILKAAQENKTVVIEGPLYEPSRSPPFYLIVEKVQIEKK